MAGLVAAPVTGWRCSSDAVDSVRFERASEGGVGGSRQRRRHARRRAVAGGVVALARRGAGGHWRRWRRSAYAWRQKGSRNCASLRSSCESGPSWSSARSTGWSKSCSRRCVRAHPYRERLRRLLMLALYRVEPRPADALAAYQRARSVLVEELGLEPSEEMRELRAGDPAAGGAAAAATAVAARSAVVGDELFGRAAELAEVDTLLAEGRLVTLTGRGASGRHGSP